MISRNLNTCTVFLAEVTAIKLAAEFFIKQQTNGSSIWFYIDNQASITALAGPVYKSKAVLACKETLDELGLSNVVKLEWIKAHNDNQGNEAADLAARQGAASHRQTGYNPLRAQCQIKAEIKNQFQQTWIELWENVDGHRQSKLFIDAPKASLWRDLQKLNKKQVSLVIQFVTGHAFLRRHQAIVTGDTSQVECQLCKKEPETPEHLVAMCPKLCDQRVKVFKALYIPNITNFDWSVRELIKFLELVPFLWETRE